MSAYDNVVGLPSDFWGAPVLRDGNGDLYCPGFVGDTLSTFEWDYCVFGGFPTPGICTVTSTKAQGVDIKKPAGKDDATQTFHGLHPGEVEIHITIWTPAQLEKLKQLWQKIMPRPGKTEGTPYDFYYPATAFLGIKSVAVVAGTFGGEGKIPRSKLFSIRATEWTKPAANKKKVTKTPVESKGSLYDPERKSNGQAPARALPGAEHRNTGP